VRVCLTLSALKTLRGCQKNLLVRNFLEKPVRGKVSGKTWGREGDTPEEGKARGGPRIL
jgi:hypothetical protein